MVAPYRTVPVALIRARPALAWTRVVVAVRPRNRCRASAKATIVPRTVAMTVATRPIFSALLDRASQRSEIAHLLSG